MDLHKCVICYQNIVTSNLKEGKIKTEEQLVNTCSNDECLDLETQLPVVFLLRKLLDIPNEMCEVFLRTYGNPKFWVVWCDSCSVWIEEANTAFQQITILQNKLNSLQGHLKNTIATVQESNQQKGNINNNEKRATDIVRSYVKGKYLSSSFSPAIMEPESIEKDNILNFTGERYSDFVPVDGECSSNSEVNLLPVKTEVNDDSLCINEEFDFNEFTPGTVCEAVINSESDSKNLNSHDGTFSAVNNNEVFATTPPVRRRNYSDYSHGPHQCRFCLKILPKHSRLIVHERIHTGERPFPCSLCNKAFKEASKLKRHQFTVHLKEKQFQCSICSERFKNDVDLIVHVQRDHQPRQFC